MAQNSGVVQSSGAAGQQDAAHLHVHLAPRWPGDDVTRTWPHDEAARSTLDRLAAGVKGAL